MAEKTAKDIMSQNPEFLPPTATLKQAATQMSKHDYGFIPVGENDRLIGAVTDRDLVVRGVAAGKDPNTTIIKDVMTEGIQFCFAKNTLPEVAKKMEELQIRRIVVLDDNKRMVGIISLGDVVTKSKDSKLSSELADAVSQH